MADSPVLVDEDDAEVSILPNAGSVPKNNKITPIPADSVHRIQSGQVILDLATSVKELLENALDAGASKVEIVVHLEDSGYCKISVADNGSGVSAENYELVAAKHATSKLRSFGDLAGVTSFGFRGEALSALAALGELALLTRTAADTAGTHLSFDRLGRLAARRPEPRPIGTTVTVDRLFAALPVRFQQFAASTKKEAARLSGLLHAYCLVSVGAAITYLHTGGRRPARLTSRGLSVLENYTDVFGAAAAALLVPVRATDPAHQLEIVGYVSNASHESGRSTGDRQFLFCNARPIDDVAMTRLANTLYRRLNRKACPVLVLDVRCPPNTYDINLNPNKRKIFFHQHAALLTLLESVLGPLYEDYLVGSSQLPLVQPALTSYLTHSGPSPDLAEPLFDEEGVEHATSAPASLDLGAAEPAEPGQPGEAEDGEADQAVGKADVMDLDSQSPKTVAASSAPRLFLFSRYASRARPLRLPSVAAVSLPPLPAWVGQADAPEGEGWADEPGETADGKAAAADYDVEYDQPRLQRRVSTRSIQFILERARARLQTPLRPRSVHASNFFVQGGGVEAEKELARKFEKADFRNIEIVGQFNLGFIIGRLRDDLFIFDQHAADEKRNYELLKETTVLKQQALLAPRPLSLTAEEELLVLEHTEVFRKNGFQFVVDESQPAGRRLALTMFPYSKATAFSERDIHELISLVREEPGRLAHLPRINDMYASRACRRAVMVGTALDTDQMRRITAGMAALKMPWSCPHGRPTMRHLCDLARPAAPGPGSGPGRPAQLTEAHGKSATLQTSS